MVLSRIDRRVGMLKSRAVVPRHPLRWAFFQFIRVALQLGEVVEGIGVTQFGAVNQAHEDVADIRAIFRFIEERVLAMQDRFL
jgi:hypothetical protein